MNQIIANNHKVADLQIIRPRPNYDKLSQLLGLFYLMRLSGLKQLITK